MRPWGEMFYEITPGAWGGIFPYHDILVNKNKNIHHLQELILANS